MRRAITTFQTHHMEGGVKSTPSFIRGKWSSKGRRRPCDVSPSDCTITITDAPSSPLIFSTCFASASAMAALSGKSRPRLGARSWSGRTPTSVRHEVATRWSSLCHCLVKHPPKTPFLRVLYPWETPQTSQTRRGVEFGQNTSHGASNLRRPTQLVGPNA